jgi:uracil-DNA glycosylase
MGISRQTDKIPPTLKILALELIKEYPNATLDYTMQSFAKQGFLMLNMALTVIEHQSRSHLTHWRPFTEFLIRKLSITNTGIIYVLLGKEAQLLKAYINPDSNYIITAPHPAAELYSGGNAGFYGCRLFLRINEIIEKQYNTQINFGQL